MIINIVDDHGMVYVKKQFLEATANIFFLGLKSVAIVFEQ